jgi:hypothetical protein
MVAAENRVPDFGIMLRRTTKVAWRGDFGKTGRQAARPFCQFFPAFSQAFGKLALPMESRLGPRQQASDGNLKQFALLLNLAAAV